MPTRLTQSCPFSVHSLGGRIEFKISSVCWADLASTGGSFFPGGGGTGAEPGVGDVEVTFKALDWKWRKQNIAVFYCYYFNLLLLTSAQINKQIQKCWMKLWNPNGNVGLYSTANVITFSYSDNILLYFTLGVFFSVFRLTSTGLSYLTSEEFGGIILKFES